MDFSVPWPRPLLFVLFGGLGVAHWIGIWQAVHFGSRAWLCSGSPGNAVRGGIDSIEHGIFMDDTCIEEMVERGTYVVPTLAAIVNMLANAEHGGIPSYIVEKAQRVAGVHRQAITAFYKAGGRIAMGTDAGTPLQQQEIIDALADTTYRVEFIEQPTVKDYLEIKIRISKGLRVGPVSTKD